MTVKNGYVRKDGGEWEAVLFVKEERCGSADEFDIHKNAPRGVQSVESHGLLCSLYVHYNWQQIGK